MQLYNKVTVLYGDMVDKGEKWYNTIRYNPCPTKGENSMDKEAQGIEFVSNVIGGLAGVGFILIPFFPDEWAIPVFTTIFALVSLVEPWLLWRILQIIVTIIPSVFLLFLLAFPLVMEYEFTFWGTVIGGGLLLLFNLFQILLSILEWIKKANEFAQKNDPFIKKS